MYKGRLLNAYYKALRVLMDKALDSGFWGSRVRASVKPTFMFIYFSFSMMDSVLELVRFI